MPRARWRETEDPAFLTGNPLDAVFTHAMHFLNSEATRYAPSWRSARGLDVLTVNPNSG